MVSSEVSRKGYSGKSGSHSIYLTLHLLTQLWGESPCEIPSLNKKQCKSHPSFTSSLRPPERLHVQHSSLEKSPRHFVTMCSLCLCYLLPPTRMESNQDMPAEFWWCTRFKGCPDGAHTPLLWSFWFHGSGLKVKDWKRRIDHKTKQKYICSILYKIWFLCIYFLRSRISEFLSKVPSLAFSFLMCQHIFIPKRTFHYHI